MEIRDRILLWLILPLQVVVLVQTFLLIILTQLVAQVEVLVKEAMEAAGLNRLHSHVVKLKAKS